MEVSKLVLDTNTYSELLRGDQVVLQYLNTAEEIFLPVFVIAELLYGFKSGKKERSNRQILENFINRPAVQIVYPTWETAEIFAEIISDLKKRGTPIPTHDIWIAACAVQTGAVVVTYDSHFSRIRLVRTWDHL